MHCSTCDTGVCASDKLIMSFLQSFRGNILCEYSPRRTSTTVYAGLVLPISRHWKALHWRCTWHRVVTINPKGMLIYTSNYKVYMMNMCQYLLFWQWIFKIKAVNINQSIYIYIYIFLLYYRLKIHLSCLHTLMRFLIVATPAQLTLIIRTAY